MKTTKKQLRKIIRAEKSRILNERRLRNAPRHDVIVNPRHSAPFPMQSRADPAFAAAIKGRNVNLREALPMDLVRRTSWDGRPRSPEAAEEAKFMALRDAVITLGPHWESSFIELVTNLNADSVEIEENFPELGPVLQGVTSDMLFDVAESL